MTADLKLPAPECESGYPDYQLRAILGDRYERFGSWMSGQTVALCNGKKYSHAQGEYYETGCGPHGIVVYKWDLERFLQGRPVFD